MDKEPGSASFKRVCSLAGGSRNTMVTRSLLYAYLCMRVFLFDLPRSLQYALSAAAAGADAAAVSARRVWMVAGQSAICGTESFGRHT